MKSLHMICFHTLPLANIATTATRRFTYAAATLSISPTPSPHVVTALQSCAVAGITILFHIRSFVYKQVFIHVHTRMHMYAWYICVHVCTLQVCAALPHAAWPAKQRKTGSHVLLHAEHMAAQLGVGKLASTLLCGTNPIYVAYKRG